MHTLGFGREPVEIYPPHRLEQRRQVSERVAVRAIEPTTALLANGHQAGVAQPCEVLADGTDGDTDLGSDVGHRDGPVPNDTQDRLPTRFGDYLEAVHDIILVTT